jgi:TetR/AcrR family transcriptional regulator, transcriptional repressor for nem operon
MAAATRRFWFHGYEATSIQDLIEATGSNRAAIYAMFGGKKGLFLACIESYRALVVTPAFAPVEADDAGLAAISAFFETQIAAAEATGLPGPGCLIANSMTEIAPHDADVQALVDAHLDRLRKGFAAALAREFATPRGKALALGQFLAVGAQGLWSYSRSVADAKPLRAHARLLISFVAGALS